jgi:hypothetical protein
MYQAPKEFLVPTEVIDFQKDRDSLGVICDLDNWYITPEWSHKFMEHFKKLEILADSGEPWSQYNLGSIYLCGYLYSSEEKFEKNYELDLIAASKWLEKAAKQGFVAAVDNLVGMGVGSESERLREITRIVENEHPEFTHWDNNKIPTILPALFETVWQRAYGKNS